jgi:hypothetical protein
VFYHWTIEADTLEFLEAIYGGKIFVEGKILAGGKIREKLLSKMSSFLLFKNLYFSVAESEPLPEP